MSMAFDGVRTLGCCVNNAPASIYYHSALNHLDWYKCQAAENMHLYWERLVLDSQRGQEALRSVKTA